MRAPIFLSTTRKHRNKRKIEAEKTYCMRALLSGAMEFSTVTKDSFQAPGVSPRVLPVKHESHSPRELLDPRGRHAQTNDASDMRTTQMDHFRGFAGDDLLRARPDAARAPPSTIELTENGRCAQNTTVQYYQQYVRDCTIEPNRSDASVREVAALCPHCVAFGRCAAAFPGDHREPSSIYIVSTV